MSASWIQDRRRKQAAGYDEKTGAALADIMGGLQASLAVPENERRRKLAEELAAGELGAKKSMAESTLLRAKTADKAAEESLLRQKGDETTRIEAAAAKKAADDAKAAKTEREESLLRRKEAVLDTKRATEGGLSRADLEQRAAALGVPPEQLLAEADMLNRDEMLAEDETKAKTAASEALAAQREAAAAKAARGPGPAKPMSAKEKALTRKAEAEATIAEREARDGKPKPVKPMLTPAEVASVLEIQGAKNMLGRLENMKTGKDGAGAIDTGPFAALASFIASKAGAGNPRMVEFKALAGEQIAGYIKSISGATVSETERRNLLENVPGVGDDDEEFLAKLKQVKDTLDAKLRLQKKAFAATGRDTAIFDVPDDVDAMPPAKKPADMSDADIEARLKELKAKR